MRDLPPKTRSQSCSALTTGQPPPTVTPIHDNRQARNMLIGLMMPMMMMVVNMTMFSVAVPTIRDQFGIQADTTSWLITAYTLPFMVAMPLYGRLGDGLGKRRLFLTGISVFWLGTLLTMLSPTLFLVILGRVIQGVGASAINPLCMAIISDRFPVGERGKALGTWNSMGPIAGIIGPLTGGFVVDHWGWRTIFWLVLLIGLVALYAISKQVPATGRSFVKPGFLKTFDWGGVIFLGLATIMMVFYLSSRPITGIDPLFDWRLLLAALILFATFIMWERRQADPFVSFEILTYLNFVRASLGSSIRMFLMGGLGFLLPLYLTDIHGVSASTVGTVTMFHALSLLILMRLGGQLADWWSSRRLVLMGTSVQVASVFFLSFLTEAAPLWMVVAGMMGHGLGAGSFLAALHRAALNKVAPEQTGTAAGLYSMIRFGGIVLGPVLGGVVLQFGLDQAIPTIEAYRWVFWFVAGVAVLGIVNAWGLRD